MIPHTEISAPMTNLFERRKAIRQVQTTTNSSRVPSR
jgi:hypothetical protein